MPESVTMWDFSWLLRRSGAEAEYADVGGVLDQLADRGYDVVRIDAFPHWIAADADGVVLEEISALPQPPGFMWGNHRAVTVRPREALLGFLSGLRDRKIRAGLSTWFTPDTTERASRVASPEDLARVWLETLRVIRDAGLIEVVRYVDLCNEWPGWAPGVTRSIFGPEHTEAAEKQPFTSAELVRIDAYQSAMDAVKAEFPSLPVTFSFFLRGPSAPLAADMMRLDTSSFDFAEPHLWLSSGCPRFIHTTSYVDDYSTDVRNLTEHEQLVRDHYFADRAEHLGELAALLDDWRAWADNRGLPLWTTEGWASIGWSPDLIDGWDGWDYVKDVGAAAVGLALQRGWQGICTSNFSQPHHVGMWADAAWHREQTDRIRQAGRTQPA